MSYARRAFEEIIRELEEKRVENMEYFEDEGNIYRLGKSDAFSEAVEYILTEFLSCRVSKEGE